MTPDPTISAAPEGETVRMSSDPVEQSKENLKYAIRFYSQRAIFRPVHKLIDDLIDTVRRSNNAEQARAEQRRQDFEAGIKRGQWQFAKEWTDEYKAEAFAAYLASEGSK